MNTRSSKRRVHEHRPEQAPRSCALQLRATTSWIAFRYENRPALLNFLICSQTKGDVALHQIFGAVRWLRCREARRHVDGLSRGNHRATARNNTNGACACGAPVGAAGFVVEVVRLTNVGAFWHRHTRGILFRAGVGRAPAPRAAITSAYEHFAIASFSSLCV